MITVKENRKYYFNDFMQVSKCLVSIVIHWGFALSLFGLAYMFFMTPKDIRGGVMVRLQEYSTIHQKKEMELEKRIGIMERKMSLIKKSAFNRENVLKK